jgi:ammonium transporter, Amt family
MRRRRLLMMVVLVLGLVGLMSGTAWAEGDPTGATKGQVCVVADGAIAEDAATCTLEDGTTGVIDAAATTAEQTRISLNMLWLVLGAALVVFMQAGFAMVETGFCRAKHASHVVMTNFMIFGLGFVAFFAVGYAFMFGATGAGAIGLQPLGDLVTLGGNASAGIIAKSGFFLGGDAYDVSVMGFFLYQVAFMDTVATIPTGAMAERWNFKNFILWGLFCGAIFYPLYGNWVWGGGWLSQLGNSAGLGHGVVDFAGSGVVHAMGGMAALAGAFVLGPRIGKFDKDGKPRAMPGHNLPLAFMGVFVLLFGWFGFNGASTFAATDLRFATVVTNTAIAGAFGAVTTMVLMMWKFGKPDPSMCANGMLAGLVAITAPCAFVAPWAAMVIGIIAGALVIAAVLFVENRLKLDDPVGAIAVHGVNGLFGVLAVGIFADGKYGDGWNGVSGGVKGLLYGDAGQLGAQAVAVGVIMVLGIGLSYAFFKLSNKIVPIRSVEADEVSGLDLPEMGAMAYPDFLEAQGTVFLPSDDVLVGAGVGGGGGYGNGGQAAKLRSEVGA